MAHNFSVVFSIEYMSIRATVSVRLCSTTFPRAMIGCPGFPEQVDLLNSTASMLTSFGSNVHAA